MNRRITILSLFVALVLLFGCSNEVKDTAEKAVDEGNPSLCRNLEDEEDVKKCYSLVAEKSNDPEVCKQSTDNNDCITNFAVEKSSLKYCDMTTDAGAKTACILSVTGDQTGRALEDILADWKSSGAVSKCKELCESPYDKCVSSGYQTFKSEEETCAGEGDVNQMHYCLDLAQKKFDNHKFGCYDDREECEAGCMPTED